MTQAVDTADAPGNWAQELEPPKTVKVEVHGHAASVVVNNLTTISRQV